MDHLVIWEETHQDKSISTGFRGYGRENNGFSLLCDFARPRNQNVM